MAAKIIIVICLLAIVISLFSALRVMSRNQIQDREKMARYLTIRVSLSLFLLLVLAIAFVTGWIQPNDVNALNPPVPKESQSQ